jgi:hypothetical protein
MFPDKYWYAIKDGDPRAAAMYERHYSCVNIKARRRTGDKRICGPGEKLVLMTPDCKALFVWRKANRPDCAGQMGVYCSIFRNEKLILEAEELARQRWPNGKRFYTYINSKRIKSSNPGYCFQMAGWKKDGLTQGGLVILEKLWNTSPD